VRGRKVAAVRAIIPANINHPELEPMIIGRNSSSNQRPTSQQRSGSSIEEEVEKMRLGNEMGGEHRHGPQHRQKHPRHPAILDLRNSPLAIGTVPIYQALEKVNGRAKTSPWEIFRDTLIEQAEQGVVLFYDPCGSCFLRFVRSRARRNDRHRQPRRLYHGEMVSHPSQGKLSFTKHWDDICDIMAAYDVSFSIGRRTPPRFDRRRERRSAIRPELKVQGGLTTRAWARACKS